MEANFDITSTSEILQRQRDNQLRSIDANDHKLCRIKKSRIYITYKQQRKEANLLVSNSLIPN